MGLVYVDPGDFLKLPKPIKEGIPMEVKGLGGLFFVGVVV